LAQTVALRGQTAEIQRVLKPGIVNKDVISGIGDGLKRSGKSLRHLEGDTEMRDALDRLLSQAAQTAGDGQVPPEARVAAIQLLTFDSFDRVSATLARQLDSKQPQEVQRAAVKAIASFSQPETAAILLGRWRESAPAIRSEIVLAMLSGSHRIGPLLKAIQDGVIPANQVPFARRGALLRSGDAQVKELATKLFGEGGARPSNELIAKYRSALALKGDAARGQKVFEASCATCHRVGEQGKDVGPNLATIRQWNPEQVLINILDPNREVAPNFVSYSVETTDGGVLDGIIAEESAGSLTLKRADGLTDTIFRRDIARLSGSGLSLMPEGLAGAITVEQMADLIAFLLPAP
jgi:putative heme-binding domain-containing protein